jgi:hypothetical protein
MMLSKQITIGVEQTERGTTRVKEWDIMQKIVGLIVEDALLYPTSSLLCHILD